MNNKIKKSSSSIEKFKALLLGHYKKNAALPAEKRDMCDPSMNAQLVVDCLADTFLGENWYITMPESAEQVNTAILFEILYRNNKEFKRWYDKTCKELADARVEEEK